MEEYYNGGSFGKVKERFKDRSKKTKERTKQMLSKQAVKIAQRAEEHEPFINKVTHLLGVLGFGAFCFILGASQYLLYSFLSYIYPTNFISNIRQGHRIFDMFIVSSILLLFLFDGSTTDSRNGITIFS
ncbi:glycerophosphocholine acyltransferase 1-like [Solanum stenotomum]|uniref:glycerophosphocholine acyltransferase 1-like n=1 Tax=Solanum stenotomum TaxID=172797 RepID=UPI0020D08F9A|nr:glycerophosphocholine acyltransferase 1-like [Solanum stenotomum]